MDISCISSHVWLLLTSSSHMLMTISCIIDHCILNQSILMAFLKPSGKSCAAKSLLFILVLHDNWFFSLPSTSYPTYTLLGRKENSSFPFFLMEKTYFLLSPTAFIVYCWDCPYMDFQILVQRIWISVEGEHDIKDSGEFPFPFLCEGVGWNKNWNRKTVGLLSLSSQLSPSLTFTRSHPHLQSGAAPS